MFIVFELFFTSLQIKVSHLAHCIFHTLLQDTGVYDITKDIQTESQESHWRVTAILILPPEDTASPTSLVYSLFYPCIFVFLFIFQKCLTYWTIQQIFSITKSQQMVQLVLNEQDNQQEMDLNCSDRRISLLPWTRGTKIVFLFNQILDRLLMPSLTRHCLRVLPLTCLAQLVPASRQASSDRIPWLWLSDHLHIPSDSSTPPWEPIIVSSQFSKSPWLLTFPLHNFPRSDPSHCSLAVNPQLSLLY